MKTNENEPLATLFTCTSSECVRFYSLCIVQCAFGFPLKDFRLSQELRKTWQCEKYSCRCHKETLIIIITMAMLFTDFLRFLRVCLHLFGSLNLVIELMLCQQENFETLFVWFETRVLNNFPCAFYMHVLPFGCVCVCVFFVSKFIKWNIPHRFLHYVSICICSA